MTVSPNYHWKWTIFPHPLTPSYKYNAAIVVCTTSGALCCYVRGWTRQLLVCVRRARLKRVVRVDQTILVTTMTMNPWTCPPLTGAIIQPVPSLYNIQLTYTHVFLVLSKVWVPMISSLDKGHLQLSTDY